MANSILNVDSNQYEDVMVHYWVNIHVIIFDFMVDLDL